MLSAEGVWIERRRDGEAELRDPKGSDGGGCWHVVGEEVFQRSCPPPTPSNPLHPYTSPLFSFFLLWASVEGVEAHHQPQQKHNKRADVCGGESVWVGGCGGYWKVVFRV